jgi:hypothetical protein
MRAFFCTIAFFIDPTVKKLTKKIHDTGNTSVAWLIQAIIKNNKLMAKQL